MFLTECLRNVLTWWRSLTSISTYHWPVLYSFNLCCTEDIALWTDWRFTRLLILAAVPISSVNILLTIDNCPFWGMINDIMLVPLLQKDTFNHSPLITCLVIVNNWTWKYFYIDFLLVSRKRFKETISLILNMLNLCKNS